MCIIYIYIYIQRVKNSVPYLNDEDKFMVRNAPGFRSTVRDCGDPRFDFGKGMNCCMFVFSNKIST